MAAAGMRIVPLTLREANDFVDLHHRHSARTSNDGGKFAIGMEADGQLVGVAIVGRPVARMLQQPGTAELLRCCVSPNAPRNATSRLAGRARRVWQQMGGTRLVSYTLSRESGASMRGAGFTLESEVPAAHWGREHRPRAARTIETEPKRRWGCAIEELPV